MCQPLLNETLWCLKIVIFIELCEFRMCVWITHSSKDKWLTDPHSWYDWNVITFGSTLVFRWEFVVEQNIALCGCCDVGGGFDQANFGTGWFAYAAPKFHKIILLTGYYNGSFTERILPRFTTSTYWPWLILIFHHWPSSW